MSRQDGHGGEAENYSFIQVKNTELRLIFSVSAVYHSSALCVFLSSVQGALHPAMTMK